MNIHKAYNLPMLHPMLQKVFQYSSDCDYATIPPEHDVLIYVVTKGHVSDECCSVSH